MSVEVFDVATPIFDPFFLVSLMVLPPYLSRLFSNDTQMLQCSNLEPIGTSQQLRYNQDSVGKPKHQKLEIIK